MTWWLRLLNITALYGVLKGENIHFEGHDEIRSPNYPNSVPAQMQKDWRVSCPEGSRIKISFSPFNVPKSDYCKMMYLSVTEGAAASDVREEVRFCGDRYHNVTTSSNQATIILRADGGTTDSNFIIHLDEIEGQGTPPTGQGQQNRPQSHQQGHQQQHQQQQHGQHQNHPPQPTKPTQPPQPTQPTQPTQPNKPTQSSNVHNLQKAFSKSIPNNQRGHQPSMTQIYSQHVTNHQTPPTTNEVINTNDLSIDQLNFLINKKAERLNSERNNISQNIKEIGSVVSKNEAGENPVTTSENNPDSDVEFLATEPPSYQSDGETTTGIYEKYLVKDDWFRIHNDGVSDVIDEHIPFNAEEYEWAFALGAIVFSISVGAVIICCYSRKAEKERARNRTESGCPLPVDKRSSFSHSMMPPMSMPSVFASTSEISHQRRQSIPPRVPIRIIPIQPKKPSNELVRPVSRDNS